MYQVQFKDLFLDPSLLIKTTLTVESDVIFSRRPSILEIFQIWQL